MKQIFTLCALTMFVVLKGWGQTTVTYNYTGSSQNFTVPTGVSSITVTCYGAGGGSGGAVGATNDNASGGGGGGATATSILSVLSGQVYTITVGAGGTAGTTSGTNGGTGGTTTLTGTAGTVTALGGGGSVGVTANTGVAGNGGTGAVAGTGGFAGGNGSAGLRTTSNEVGGAGGGGAGNNGAGTAGISTSAASNTTGGTGGTGNPNTNPYKGGAGLGATTTTGSLAGVAGTSPGGGAAGAATYTTAATGAVGGAGQVVIVYTVSCTPPTTQAIIGTYTNNTTGNTITANWARGNGTGGVLVTARLTTTANATPVSGTTYTANPLFGSGSTTGTGNYVVYSGTGTTVNVTGLAPGTGYTFTVYEYNTGLCYNITGSSSAVTILAACTNTTMYPTSSFPAPGAGVTYTITTVQYQQEYNQMTGAAASTSFTSTASISGTYITIRSSTYNGTVVAQGLTPLTWTAPAAVDYFIHYNLNNSCGTASVTMTTAITNNTVCSLPSIQATIGTYTNNTTGNSLTVNWARGNGSNVIVVGRLTSTTAAGPANGTSYTANAAFGSGSTTGTGNYVVYNGTGTNVNVTGLTQGTGYTFTVYEFNNAGPCYLTPGSSGAVTTITLPPVIVPASGNNSVACGTSSSLYDDGGASANYSNNDNGYTVLNNGGTGVITLSGTYNTEATYDFLKIYSGVGTGGTLLASYSGSGTIATITSATGTPITVQFTSDGSTVSTGFALSAVYTGSCTIACTPPTTQATIGAYTNNTTGNSLTVNWTRGNGTNVLVVARLTSTTNAPPVNGSAYTANAAFGSGSTTGTGNYVVYNGTGTTVNVTGLTGGTGYTFVVYEFNSAGPCYTTTGSSSAVTTLSACVNTTMFPASSFAAPAASITYTITTAQYQQEYNQMTGAVAGTSFTSTASLSNTYITVRSGSYNGAVVASGLTPLTWTAPSAVDYFIHYNASSSCGTAATGMTTTITNNTPLPSCVTPNSPTGLVLTPQTGGGSIAGTFTAPSPAPSAYLVIRTTTATAPSTPVTGTTYTAGTTALGGYIVSTNTTTGFTDNGLSPSTPYWYWIYSYNNTSCSGGPKYSATSLNGNATTTSCASNALYWAGLSSTISGTSGTDISAAANWSTSSSSYIASAYAPNTCTDAAMTITGVSYPAFTQSTALTVNSFALTLNATSSSTDYYATLTISKNFSVTNALTITNSSPGNGDHEIDFIVSGGITTCGSLTTTASGTGIYTYGPEIDLVINSGTSLICNTNYNSTCTNSSYTNTFIVNNGTFTVNGTTTASCNASALAEIYLLIGNNAITTFTGTAIIGNKADNSGYNETYLGGSTNNTTGKFVFKGDLTLGPSSATATSLSYGYPLYPSGSIVFDGTSAQKLKDNTGSYYHIPGNILIGSANSPTVTFETGSSPFTPDDMFDVYTNLSINNNSTLVIPSGIILNNYSGSGTFTMSSGATIKVAGISSTNTPTGYTEINSNFPFKFSTYTLDVASISEYYGTTQTVYATPAYGNLTIGDVTTLPPSTATAGNALTIKGNVLVNPSATFNGSSFLHSLYGNWTNNGTFNGNTSTVNFTTTNPLNVSISGNNVTTFNNFSVSKSGGVVTMNKDVIVASVINISNGVLSINDKTLTLNGTSNAATTTTGRLTGSALSSLIIGSGATVSPLYFTPNVFSSSPYNSYLKSFKLNSSSNATLYDSLNITAGTFSSPGTLLVSSGATLTTGGAGTAAYLTMKSNAGGDARIDNGTGKVNGNVRVERYIPAARAWRFLSVPFNSSTQTINTAWQEGYTNTNLNCPTQYPGQAGFGTEITYNGVNGYDLNITSNTSIKAWTSNAWITPTGTNIQLNTYPAYCLFVRGDRTLCLNGGIASGSNNTVLRPVGALNEIGSNNNTVTKTYSGSADDFIFIGNPYVSAININGVLTNSTGIGTANKFWVWNPNTTAGLYNTGQYITITNGIQAPTGSTYSGGTTIQSGQAFFVQTPGGSASINFNESDKITAETNVYSRQQQQFYPLICMNLMSAQPAGNLSLTDGVVTAFGNRFSAALDANDAQKLWNFDENIVLVRGTSTLAIEFRPVPTLADTLFYRLYLRQQPYTLQVFSQNLPGNNMPAKAWLVDNYLKTKTEINLYDTTLYNFTPNTDTMSYRNRFMLVFNRQLSTTPVPVSKVTNQSDPNTTGNGITIAAAEGTVSVTPNPVTAAKNAMLRFSNMAKGNYEVVVYDGKGRKLATKHIQHDGSNTIYHLPSGASWPAGVYLITVLNQNKTRTLNEKLVISK